MSSSDPGRVTAPSQRWRNPARVALSVGLVLMFAAGIGLVSLLRSHAGGDRADAAEARGASTADATTGPVDPASPLSSATPTTPATNLPATPPAGASAPAKPPAPAGSCAFTVTQGVCPAAPPAAAPAGKRWQVTFSEEFNGTTLDKAKLTPCFDWNGGDCTSTFNDGREHYQPSQVAVSNGTAKLIAAPLSPPYASSACQNGSCTYKAGLLSTARAKASASNYLYSFTYGYVESRFLFPATQGFFTAFWMLPADPSYTYRSEIDILELLGDDPTTMYMTYHYDNRSQSYPVNTGKFKNGACATKDYSKDFVRMGVDWQADHVAWYIDGKKCAEFTSSMGQIENGPMQIILHMMVDNEWQRRWNVGLTDPSLTRQLEVDYLRVYQQVPA
jgi:beta-glucanase (GH16 family)